MNSLADPILAPVTAIIPCFRCADTIERAVESVFNQTIRPLELILIDDCSSDGTLEMLYCLQETYPKNWIKVISLPKNCGPGAARNAGWDIAQGEYIAFLDADDTWYNQKIEIQYKWMVNHKFCDLLGHKCSYPHSKNKQNFKFKKIYPYRILISNPFPTPSIMLKKNIHYRFDQKYFFLEDHLLWSEIALSTHSCYMYGGNLANIHKKPYGEGGLSKNVLKMEIGELRMYFVLYRKRYISFLTSLFFYFFSIIKFIRRIVILAVK